MNGAVSVVKLGKIAARGAVRGAVVLACAALLLSACQRLQLASITDKLIPSNNRDWSPQFRALSYAEIDGSTVHLHNIRNNLYVAEDDFIVQTYDRSFDLSEIETVDFIVVPFQGMESIAHTMLSFGLADGTYLCLSVEVRTERGESYSTALGISREFELTYVVADERDVIRLRTRHRDADVYIYPTQATAEQAQKLFLDMIERATQLRLRPEFYDTVRNNCTTNLVRHINRVFPSRVPLAWQVLFSGHSDRYAYDLGLLDSSLPFEKLKAAAYVNDLAEAHYDAPDFSQKIRQRRASLERLRQASAESQESPAAATRMRHRVRR